MQVLDGALWMNVITTRTKAGRMLVYASGQVWFTLWYFGVLG